MAELSDVGVIIPAWRAAATIGRALASVAAQTCPPAEVIVVDDGSDDGTFEAAQACSAAMGAVRLTVLRQENAGAGAARNRALAATTARYVAFLDADDEWLPTKIERSLAYLEGTRHVLVSHDFVAVRDGVETRVDCFRHFQAAKDPYAALFVRAFVATTTVVARRDTVLAAGGFDTALRAAQDYDLWLALLAPAEASFAVFPEALTRYHFSPQGITSNVERRRQCSLAVMRKNAWGLPARKRSPWAPLFARCLVIHYEAVTGHWLRGRRSAALVALLRLPLELARLPLTSFRRRERADQVPKPVSAAARTR